MGRDSLLCAREYLDDACDEAHDEADTGKGVEEDADAPHYAHRFADLCGDFGCLGCFADACYRRAICVSDRRRSWTDDR